uniref:Periviscerokinin-2 n=1 Tax=Mantis religiosa TaxID=7507 RepID=PVK2_MANRE|nr:RecName: Full=Periviscerokinin-2; Short=Manre-PVK-2 [Mantis religiosa]
GASGLIPFPRL